MSAALETSVVEEEEPKGLSYQLKNTTVMPMGIQVTKFDSPEGTVVLLKLIEGMPVAPGVMVPLSIMTFKLDEEQARELVDLFNSVLSGIHIARAGEMPR